jgi:hypothetical protein
VNLSIELLDGDGSDKFIAGGEITALFCIQGETSRLSTLLSWLVLPCDIIRRRRLG